MPLPLLVPFFLYLFAYLILIFGIDRLIKRLTKPKGKKMVILGMPGSGKTTLHYFLRNIVKEIKPTTKDLLEEAKVKINGKEITFSETVDISGSKEWVSEYLKLLNSNEVCIFLFDISEYINNTDYLREVNGRLQYISSTIATKDIEFYLLGTHYSKLKEQKESLKKIKKHCSSEINNLFKTGRFSMIEMTDKKQLETLQVRLFS